MQKNYYIKINLGKGVTPTAQNPFKMPVYVACQNHTMLELGRALKKGGVYQTSSYEVWGSIDSIKSEKVFDYLYRVVGFGKSSDFGKRDHSYVILEPANIELPIDTFMGLPYVNEDKVEKIMGHSLTEEDVEHLKEETSKMEFKDPIFLPKEEDVSEKLLVVFSGASAYDIDYDVEDRESIVKFIRNTRVFLSKVAADKLESHRYISILCDEIQKEKDNYITSMKLKTLKEELVLILSTDLSDVLLLSFNNKFVSKDDLPKVSKERLEELMRDDWV